MTSSEKRKTLFVFAILVVFALVGTIAVCLFLDPSRQSKPVTVQPFTATVQRGQGLCNFVPTMEAIDVAREYGLPIYRGEQVNNSSRITPDEAAKVVKNGEKIDIIIHPGDEFRPGTLEYRSKNGHW